MCECLLFMFDLRLHVVCRNMRFRYTSLPCLLVWLSCMWLSSYCDDHQFYWWEQIGEHPAVVRMIRMIQLDGLDEYWAQYGAHRWRIYLLCFSLICTRLRIISSLVYFCFRPCGVSFLFYGCVWETVYFISQFRTLWIIMYGVFH